MEDHAYYVHFLLIYFHMKSESMGAIIAKEKVIIPHFLGAALVGPGAGEVVVEEEGLVATSCSWREGNFWPDKSFSFPFPSPTVT